MSGDEIRRTIDAVWRIEAAKLIAALTRLVRDVGLAEELAQDALLTALEQWPRSGVPDHPGAWLMTAAKRHGIDLLRHRGMQLRKADELTREIEAQLRDAQAGTDTDGDDPVGDDLLRLMFIACHPLLSADARVALTLRLLGGLTTAEIARAFLVPEATIAQRIVRAKRTLGDAQVPFELPPAHELGARLGSVLEVLYLIFNEGYAATAGDDWMRPTLCTEALRLARILAGLAADHAEVHGLLALMEIQASRTAARTDTAGQPVLLLEQNRALWDPLLIGRGLAALQRAEALAATPGSYTLQAAIAACHARARRADDTDWPRIAALYAQLAAHAPSPVVELNRAVAVAMAEGPAAGLAIVETLREHALLRHYHLLPSVRADLLEKLGRRAEARTEFERAAALAQNVRERSMLMQRAATCAQDLAP